MKAVKTTARRSLPFPPLTIETLFKKARLDTEALPAQNGQQSEFIVIPTKNIAPAQRAKLLPLGFPIGVRDDLLRRLAQLEKENRHLKSLSVTDELTDLYNKRFFNRQLLVEIARTQRTGEPFCLLFIDLDNFKVVNDTMGHTKGDEFLVKMCRQVIANIRPTDFACRFGGDEFAIILPATSLRDGIVIAGRWHELFSKVAAGMRVPVSSSIGIDEFNASSNLSAEEFLYQVDQLLYKAKKTGKGKIVHPEIVFADARAVTWAEKEILYHIFQPMKQKKPLRQKERSDK